MPKHRLGYRLTLWFLFTIGASIVPFVFIAVGYGFAGHWEKIWLLFRKGELLLVSSGLAAGSIADAISFPSKHRIAQLLCLAFCGFVFVLAALGYTLIAVFDTILYKYDPLFVDLGSIFLFLLMVICSAITVTHSKI
jgi:hypothetical protein